MYRILRMAVLVSLALVAGCSTVNLKQTLYETLQNIGQQECEKSLSPDCDKHISYDQYQRERNKQILTSTE